MSVRTGLPISLMETVTWMVLEEHFGKDSRLSVTTIPHSHSGASVTEFHRTSLGTRGTESVTKSAEFVIRPLIRMQQGLRIRTVWVQDPLAVTKILAKLW